MELMIIRGCVGTGMLVKMLVAMVGRLLTWVTAVASCRSLRVRVRVSHIPRT